jgi:hypothetical protein
VSTEVAIWLPLASGVLGIMGALAGSAATQRATRRREDRRWERERELDQVRYERERLARQRERRVALYVDLAEYAQSEQSRLEIVTDEFGEHRQQNLDLGSPDRLTARVKLYAAPDVRESWLLLIQALEHLRWEYFEGDNNHSEHHIWLDQDNPAVVKLRAAIEQTQSALNAAIDKDS